jgi:hypothetical protein
MLHFQEEGCVTKGTDSGAGRPSGLPVEVSYGRAGSLSRGLSCRQLGIQMPADFEGTPNMPARGPQVLAHSWNDMPLDLTEQSRSGGRGWRDARWLE